MFVVSTLQSLYLVLIQTHEIGNLIIHTEE